MCVCLEKEVNYDDINPKHAVKKKKVGQYYLPSWIFVKHFFKSLFFILLLLSIGKVGINVFIFSRNKVLLISWNKLFLFSWNKVAQSMESKCLFSVKKEHKERKLNAYFF